MKSAVLFLITTVLLVATPAHSDEAMMYFNLGVQESVTRKKIEYFTKALELDPRLAEVYEKRGMLYYWQGKYQLSIEDFTAYTKLAGANGESYRMLGMGYLKKRFYEPAVHYFTLAINMELERVEAYANRAEAYRLMGRDEEAIRDASKAIGLRGDPRSRADAYRTRFKIYWQRGEDKLARADYRRSVELDPRIVLWRYPDKRYPSPEEISHLGLYGIIGIAFVWIFGKRLRPPDKN
ncbi:MAG: tetratricopeptide repeat protein [Deltaproteobacteria bacterium]|nr:MAG: tetratricopeptide repeat protein [Deltaproteobacteria bacterium]